MSRSDPGPGIHRVLDDPVRLAAALRHNGWTVGRLDTEPGLTRRQVLARIGQVLEFPSYYGRNLDALDECLADLAAPTALLWSGWQACAGADPQGWGILLEIFGERSERSPKFALLLC